MVRRIIAIAFIFICSSIAWVILGSNIFMRTRGSDQNLRSAVGSTWGTAQVQRAPVAFTERLETRTIGELTRPNPAIRGRDIVGPPTTTTAPAAPLRDGNRTETVRTRVPLALDQTRAAVDFNLDHRRKGLLWYSTYAVKFGGTRSEEHTSELQSPCNIVCRLRRQKKKT